MCPLLMLVHIAFVNKSLAAHITLEWLFASMSAHVNDECILIGQWSLANVAYKWFFATMRLLMTLQTPYSGKCLATHIAYKFGRILRMHSQLMYLHLCFGLKSFLTYIAHIVLHIRVYDHMHLHLVFVQKLFLTNIAFEKFPGIAMHFHPMHSTFFIRRKYQFAFAARIRSLHMHIHMQL